MQNGYPYSDIPKILKYCPQLLIRFSVEEIAMACLSEMRMFTPKKMSINIRPFVYRAAKEEVGDIHEVTSFIEQAIAIFSSDTLEITFTDMIRQLRIDKGLR
jgi:hypothetical protein